MLTQLSDREVLSNIKILVAQERLTLEKILEHLAEIQRRRLYADLGYSSLFKYLVKGLGYSEGAAVRRIGALKLVQLVPEAKHMIASGELNLTVASQTQDFSKTMDVEETRLVLDAVKGKSKDEATVALLQLKHGDTSAAVPAPEKKTRLTPTQTRVHVTLENETLKKFERLKAIKKLSSDQALDFALGIALAKEDERLTKTKKSKSTTTRAIPMAHKKIILKRAERSCEFPGCGEIRNLEFEHIIPFAQGGGHTISNLKLYCRSHNQRAAIKLFGQHTMNKFIN